MLTPNRLDAHTLTANSSVLKHVPHVSRHVLGVVSIRESARCLVQLHATGCHVICVARSSLIVGANVQDFAERYALKTTVRHTLQDKKLVLIF